MSDFRFYEAGKGVPEPSDGLTIHWEIPNWGILLAVVLAVGVGAFFLGRRSRGKDVENAYLDGFKHGGD